MDDLYGNAWGDPLNNYPDQPYLAPTWNAQPPPPKSQSPVQGDHNDLHVSEDESEVLSTEPQPHVSTSDTSWTADDVPWPAEENQVPFHSAWMTPTNVWSSTEQPQTPVVPILAATSDIPPKSPSLASPPLPKDPIEKYSIPSEQGQDTPVQSRAHSPDQFGTFESGTADAAIPTGEAGWGSPEYSTFDDSVDPSNAWGQQGTAKVDDTQAEPADEWEAARRMKEKVDKRVVRTKLHPSDFGRLLNGHLAPGSHRKHHRNFRSILRNDVARKFIEWFTTSRRVAPELETWFR